MIVRGGCLILLCLGLLACPSVPGSPSNPDNPNNPVPGVQNALLHRGLQYAINHGLISFGSKEGNHFATTLEIADGVFIPTTLYYGDIPVTTWSPEAGEADILIKLYTAGNSFEAGTYSFITSLGEGPILPNPQWKTT